MPATIDLPAANLAEVRRLLAQYAPGCEVRAFGSRVTGEAERYSDLDLALLRDRGSSTAVLEFLRDAFSESNLPITVDVMGWTALGERIREAIGDRFVVLQPPGAETPEESSR